MTTVAGHHRRDPAFTTDRRPGARAEGDALVFEVWDDNRPTTADQTIFECNRTDRARSPGPTRVHPRGERHVSCTHDQREPSGAEDSPDDRRLGVAEVAQPHRDRMLRRDSAARGATARPPDARAAPARDRGASSARARSSAAAIRPGWSRCKRARSTSASARADCSGCPVSRVRARSYSRSTPAGARSRAVAAEPSRRE